MADPICRWRNPSVKTLCEFVLLLPKQQMPKESARQLIEKNAQYFDMSNFFKTAYQAAKQQGVFYEDDEFYYPRFTDLLSLNDAKAYLKHWISLYYFPNPYVKSGFNNFNAPKLLLNNIYHILNASNGKALWSDVKKAVFEEEIGNDDIIQNALSFSDTIAFDNEGYIYYKNGAESHALLGGDDNLTVAYDRNDAKAFFEHFGPTGIEALEPSMLQSFNQIYFGAPGTGKSFDLNVLCNSKFNERFERVTFYPTYSFGQFVGTYKPIMQSDGSSKEDIAYKYVPGPFLRIWKKAYTTPDEKFLLVIEELNRANAASVFGDMFQLLDRKDDGTSEYPIAISEDLKKHLADEGIILPNDQLSLPSNMYIFATMNSADQGVFPLDTAFKRRWDYKYFGIDEKEADIANYTISIGKKRYKWNAVRKAINNFLIEHRVNEDKLLGPHFLKKSVLTDEKDAFINAFKNKVLMYLFDDAARQCRRELFVLSGENKLIYSELCDRLAKEGIGIFNIQVDESTDVVADVKQ